MTFFTDPPALCLAVDWQITFVNLVVTHMGDGRLWTPACTAFYPFILLYNSELRLMKNDWLVKNASEIHGIQTVMAKILLWSILHHLSCISLLFASL